MNKKALELSINFIVIVIISLVIFGMGIGIANKFLGQAEVIKQDLDQQTENQINAMLDSGDRLAIPIDNKIIEKGKSDVFGLGILNILGQTRTFTVTISSSLYVSPTKQTENPPTIPLEFIEVRSKELKNNEHDVMPLVVRAPRNARPGTYVLNVHVSQYDETLQITVRVK